MQTFVAVDCQMESSSTSGPCEADCGSKNGTRKVVWSEKIVAEAMYGGKPCDKEESSWTTTELCTTDKIVPCTGEIFFAGSIFLSRFDETLNLNESSYYVLVVPFHSLALSCNILCTFFVC